MQHLLVRNEFKHDAFRSDLQELLQAIQQDYIEISRPYSSTATLYFYDRDLGPPNIDMALRLRAYTNVDLEASATLDHLKALDWHIERKGGHVKEDLGELSALPESSASRQEAYQILHQTHQPNVVKVCRRRHFAIKRSTDESHRITVDLSRAIIKVVDHTLQPLGDAGPRIEVKLPRAEPEDELPIAKRLQEVGHWSPFGTLGPYFQFLLGQAISSATYEHLPEIEIKHLVTARDPQQVFVQLHDWLLTKQRHWHLLLPFPHSLSRTRRYHVCAGPDPESTYTVVETAASRCSLKIKRDPRQEGAVLLRRTEASHSTDVDGAAMLPVDFIRSKGLRKLNAFTKSQLKVPVALPNGHAFQFSVDQCVDPAGRRLDQLELEYIGSTGPRPTSNADILDEIGGIAHALLASPLGGSLQPTHVSKHAFFTQGH